MSETNIIKGYHHRLDIPPHTEWDMCADCDNMKDEAKLGTVLPPNTPYTCNRCGLAFTTPLVPPAKPVPIDKKPRSTWMKTNGVDITWTHVCGDPFQLDMVERVRKPEPVQFCIILRNTKAVSDGFDRAWFATGYTMGSGLFPEMVAAQRKLRSGHTFKVGMDDLRKKYLKPDIESFLASLISDLRPIADGQTCEEFVEDMGVEDPKDGYRIWKALKRAWSDMVELLGTRKAREYAMLDIEDDYR